MPSKLFIGGLAWSTDAESLRSAFEPYGPVEDAVVISDRETGRSRGFGFVTFGSDDDADKAIEGLNNQNLEGRTIRVDRANGGGAGGFSRGGGFNGGFNNNAERRSRDCYNCQQPGHLSRDCTEPRRERS